MLVNIHHSDSQTYTDMDLSWIFDEGFYVMFAKHELNMKMLSLWEKMLFHLKVTCEKDI